MKRNFRIELLRVLLANGIVRLNNLIVGFIHNSDESARVTVVGIISELEEKGWVKMNSREYCQLRFRNQELDFEIIGSLTYEGIVKATEILEKIDGQRPTAPLHEIEPSASPESSSQPTVFLSYCWHQNDEAERIYTDLSQVGIALKKDNHELAYRDSLSKYMNSIRNNDFALLIISDQFLKSRNCMIEVLNLRKEQNYSGRMLPVLIAGTPIYSPNERVKYIQYWESEKGKLETSLKEITNINAISAQKDLKDIVEIAQCIDDFLKEISDGINITTEDLKAKNYKPVLDKLGYLDFSFALELLRITTLNDIEDREIALADYANRHSQNSFYYGVMATTANMGKKFSLAKEYYLKSITLKPDNVEALNNLGMLYWRHFKENDRAKDCFAKAITIDPQLTVARLNLGVLMSECYNNFADAKRQYEAILEYDPFQCQAHSNLGNIYRSEEFNSFAKAEFHLKKAIEICPDHIPAYLNYGNILKVKGEIDEGNRIYKRALQRPSSEPYRDLLETVLQSNKG